MAYDPERVDLTAEEHETAKEVNEFFEALVYGNGDQVKEGIEAVMQVLAALPSAEDKKVFLFKVLLANISDELQQQLAVSP